MSDIKDIIDQYIYESGTKDITGVALNGVLKQMVDVIGMKKANEVLVWAQAEAFDIENMTFTAAGNIQTADLKWPDGESGTISNVSETNGLLTNIRFNYDGTAKYVELSITWDAGEVEKTEWTTNGF